MIDRRELLENARRRKLPLMIIEKDYVLGWMLFGFSTIKDIVFKGGTALSKIYFPEIWRLSEDLDFTYTGDNIEELKEPVKKALLLIEKKSGIKLGIKSEHSNPDYLQLKMQYAAVLGKNWVKADITRDVLADKTMAKELSKNYSDYPTFKINVKSREEIFAAKLRALIERSKCRDYYDVWRLSGMDFNEDKVKRLFLKKCESRNISFTGVKKFFPQKNFETLKPYWKRELGRLVNPTPDLKEVLDDLRKRLGFLKNG